MAAQNGNSSPYILIGIVLVAILIVVMLFSGQNGSPLTGSYPIPTSGSEVP